MGTFIGFILLYTFVCMVVYFLRPNKDRESLYITVFLLYSTLFLFVFSVIFVTKGIISNGLWLLPFICGTIFFKYKIDKEIDNKNKVVAKQLQFWDIPVSHILNTYKNRIVKLEGREEIKEVDNKNYFIMNKLGEKMLLPEIYSSIKRYKKFTKIKDSSYFEKTDSKVHKLLYNKIKSLNKQNEANLDFEKILKDNHFVLQFFILDLWERLTKVEAIGVANLKSIAENEKERHLIGAIYGLEYIPQREGLELLAHYLHFKNRLKKIIQEEA